MAQNRPTGSGDGLDSVLAELSEPLRKLADAAERANGGSGAGPPRRPDNWADKLAHHIRRYAPLYAIGTIWALMLILVPTVNDSGEPTSQAAQITEGQGQGQGQGTSQSGVRSGTSSSSSSPGSTTTSSPGADGANGGTTTATGGSGTQAAATAPEDGGGGGEQTTAGGPAPAPEGPGPYPWPSQGTTTAGFECKDGVRQLPWSDYAVPCREAFTGSNGGETYQGVTADTIKFVIRVTADAGGPNQETIDAFQSAAGNATAAEAIDIFKRYGEYFNGVFELYGREVIFERYESTSSNRVDEAQSKGREGACADATAIDEQGAFAVIAYDDSIGETEPFSDCASQRELFVPIGAFYFPEKWYAERWHPFVWNTVQECERIARDVAEYMGKRLLGRKAKWAGDHHSNTQLYTQQERVFGNYVPDNDGYQRCVNIFEDIFASEYGGEVSSRFNYQLDVSRFPDQASQAVVQFKADGVTTLINACDTISTTFLTQNAKANDWWPEWYLIGVAGQDTPGPAREFDQDEVNGHMFGMSQVGDPVAMSSEEGEAAIAWKNMTDQWPPPDGFDDIYFFALHTFNLLQAAGPVLTPDNIAQGVFALPPGGGPNGAMGTWNFGSDPVYGVDHTAIDDSREIFWDGTAEDPGDGQQGTFKVAHDGRRFKTGEWTNDEPPIYPNGHP